MSAIAQEPRRRPFRGARLWEPGADAGPGSDSQGRPRRARHREASRRSASLRRRPIPQRPLEGARLWGPGADAGPGSDSQGRPRQLDIARPAEDQHRCAGGQSHRAHWRARGSGGLGRTREVEAIAKAGRADLDIARQVEDQHRCAAANPTAPTEGRAALGLERVAEPWNGVGAEAGTSRRRPLCDRAQPRGDRS